MILGWTEIHRLKWSEKQMATQRQMPARRRGGPGQAPKGDEPRTFAERMAAARTMTEAADDGYTEVVRDDRLDYTGYPMLLNKWQVKADDTTYNGKTHARVWAEVALPDRPDGVRIRFWDYGGDIGDALLEFERCGTRGNVAVMLDAREYLFDGGVGYAYSFVPIPDDGEPPALETVAEESDGPDY
jgi:hypothetical protein